MEMNLRIFEQTPYGVEFSGVDPKATWMNLIHEVESLLGEIPDHIHIAEKPKKGIDKTYLVHGEIDWKNLFVQFDEGAFWPTKKARLDSPIYSGWMFQIINVSIDIPHAR